MTHKFSKLRDKLPLEVRLQAEKDAEKIIASMSIGEALGRQQECSAMLELLRSGKSPAEIVQVCENANPASNAIHA
jgi:hypothetical protein